MAFYYFSMLLVEYFNIFNILWLSSIIVLLCIFEKLGSKSQTLIYGRKFSKQGDEEQFSNFSDESPALPIDLQHVPLVYTRKSEREILKFADEFSLLMKSRRTVRHFSKDDVPIEVIRNIIKSAGNSPSGVHTQPWTYIIVKNPKLKEKIRLIVEAEEKINYSRRMGKTWTTDLIPLRTNWVKEYLTDAPYLILVFKQVYGFKANGHKRLHYFNETSVCISAGILLTAIHYAGLVSVLSTPMNCGPALRTLFQRPLNEKLAFLLPVGYPADDCLVPQLKRKELNDFTLEYL